MAEQSHWTENIILVDADYVDKVVFDLTVNFERMLEHRIPQADMARWVECVALDGGLREGNHSTNVILVHEKDSTQLKNFMPCDYQDELNGQAFSGPLGEFTFSSVSTEAIADKTQLLSDMLEMLLQQTDIKRLMVIPNDHIYNKVRESLRQADERSDRRITVFTMHPMHGGAFQQELLGYSLMSALGIKADELKTV